jgi:hypothetical protein
MATDLSGLVVLEEVSDIGQALLQLGAELPLDP